MLNTSRDRFPSKKYSVRKSCAINTDRSVRGRTKIIYDKYETPPPRKYVRSCANDTDISVCVRTKNTRKERLTHNLRQIRDSSAP